MIDGEYVCIECAKENVENVIEEFCGSFAKAIPEDFDLSEHGWKKLDREFENGLHYGQNDSPEVIAHDLIDRGVERFIFQIDGASQFSLSFAIWIPEDCELNPEDVESEGVNNAEMLSKALKSVPPNVDGYVNVHKLQSDGSVVTELVTPDRFINGI